LQQLAFAVTRAQFQGVLFLNGGAVGRVGDDAGVFAQVFGGLARIGQQVVLQLGELAAEEVELLLTHVFAVRHGQQLGLGQLPARLVFPCVGEFGVDLGSGGAHI